MNEQKPDLSVLFPDIEVVGYKVRAWSLGKIERIAPHLERIIFEIKKRNLKIEELIKDPTELFFSLINDIAPIISITTGEKIEVIRELPVEDAVKLALTIAQQNVGYLKNVLIPLQAMILAIATTTVKTPSNSSTT